MGGGAGAAGEAGMGGGAGGGEILCEEEIFIQAELREERLYQRGETVEISVEASEGSQISALSELGGRIQDRGDRWIWSPGLPDQGGIPTPWFTAPVPLHFVAELGACRVETEILVQLAGDVLVGDYRGGELYLYDLSGRLLSQFAQGADRGAGHIIMLPEEEGGDLLISGKGAHDALPQIVRMTRSGERLPVVFEMEDIEGQPLYERERGPEHLLWDPQQERLLGDGGPDGKLYAWDLQGRLQETIQLPDTAGGSGTWHYSVGLAYVEGKVWAGWEGRTALYHLDDLSSPFSLNEGLYGVTEGAEGGLLVLEDRGNDFCYRLYQSTGAVTLDGGCHYLEHAYYFEVIPGGYLFSNGNSGGLVERLSLDLQPDLERWSIWDRERPGPDTASGILWLD